MVVHNKISSLLRVEGHESIPQFSMLVFCNMIIGVVDEDLVDVGRGCTRREGRAIPPGVLQIVVEHGLCVLNVLTWGRGAAASLDG